MKILKRTDVEGSSLLRVYTLAGDRVKQGVFKSQSFAEAIVNAARRAELMGATVLSGITGFGQHGFDTELMVMLYQPQRQPLVVEIVDELKKLEAFMATLETMNRWGRLVTLERVKIHAYHSSHAKS